MSKQKLVMMKGLQGSGKSTEAYRLVKEEGFKRVNKDDLRAMIDCGKWSRKNEAEIKAMEMTIAACYLAKGHNVVVDDTNFAYEDFWENVAEKYNAEFEVKFFDTPLMECIERDSKRGDKSVGAKVIMRMYEQYLKPEPIEYNPELQDCYITDIDGTLADAVNRNIYDLREVYTDLEIKPISNIIKRLENQKTKIIVVSGRTDDSIIETTRWLVDKSIPFENIFMRKTGDNRKDSIVKKEIYEQNIKGKYNVLGIFDDRNQCVDLWRSLGLTCLQVSYGNF